MTRDDDQLRQLFAEIRFVDEPPFAPGAGSVADDVERARRELHKRRWRSWGAAAASGAVIVSGVAFAAPNLSLGESEQGPVADRATDDAADGSASGEPFGDANPGPASVEINSCPAEPPVEDATGMVGFPNTRQCLLEIATKHFDPESVHLPERTSNVGSGIGESGVRVSTKLDWVVPGEDGLGMVQVAVTTPGFADDEHAVAGMPGMTACGSSPDACRSVSVPGTEGEVLVVEDDPERGWVLAVAYERPDGSIVSVAVDNLFGNNSLVPVSNVDITLDEAIAFVTDPALKVDEVEAEEGADEIAREFEAEDPANGDYSSTEIIPAPDTRDMTDEEAHAALDACVESMPAWSDFEPEFGVWMTTPSGEEESLVIAERGDTKMECRARGASLFGTPEVKGSPYLRGPVSYNNMTFGRYVAEVDQVTVQPSGGPAYEAVLKNGYWFLPEALGNLDMPAVRGYDAAGERIYDSVTEDRDQCYTDPDGEEVVFYQGDEVPAVGDCVPAQEWDH